MSDVDLAKKVEAWLEKEGYPLEYKTATAFNRAGFRTFQGRFVTDKEQGTPREVDVIANADDRCDKTLLRASFVIECRWTDRPWVILTSPRCRIAQQACVNQTIASVLGDAILWKEAGNQLLHDTPLFHCPVNPGFSGRQFEEKSRDSFYNIIQSVTAKACSQIAEYDDRRINMEFPDLAAIIFPLVVLEKGMLFTAEFDGYASKLRVTPSKHVRVHWTGSSHWRHHATVDFISSDHLDDFAEERAAAVGVLLGVAKKATKNLKTCYKRKSLRCLKVPPLTTGGRGTVGLPKLLALIRNKQTK